MGSALIVSNLLLWIAVLALAAVVVALLRQIGVLHERIAPVGALVGGERPRVGERAPILEVEGWSRETFRIGGRFEADSAAHLNGHIHGGEDRPHRIDVRGAPVSGSVQIDHVDPFCTEGLPALGDLYRIGSHRTSRIEVALHQSDGVPVHDVDGWNEKHV